MKQGIAKPCTYFFGIYCNCEVIQFIYWHKPSYSPRAILFHCQCVPCPRCTHTCSIKPNHIIPPSRPSRLFQYSSLRKTGAVDFVHQDVTMFREIAKMWFKLGGTIQGLQNGFCINVSSHMCTWRLNSKAARMCIHLLVQVKTKEFLITGPVIFIGVNFSSQSDFCNWQHTFLDWLLVTWLNQSGC